MSEPALSAAVYVGGAILLTGLITLIVGPRRLRIPTHRRARLIAIAGLALSCAALRWPTNTYEMTAQTYRVEFPRDPSVAPVIELWQGYELSSYGIREWLDVAAPTWQFCARHELRIDAPAALVYRAVRDTTTGEIWLVQTLTAIRRFGQSSPEKHPQRPERSAMLDVATRCGFVLLHDRPGQEIAIGFLVIVDPRVRAPTTTAAFLSLHDPGVAKATMNFHLTAEGAGTRLTTETRVFATDPASRRRFAADWRIIYPGSALIRYSWLRAIRLRAESAARPLGSS